MINKEKHAVDSEYKNGLTNDDIRLEYVDKATSNQNHPYSKFEIGNLQTLSSDSNSNLTKKVKGFFEKHYFAENMVLTLYGPQPIDELQGMAETYFSSIKSGQSEPAPYKNIPIYRKEDLGKIITIQSAQDQQSLILSFPIKNEMQQYLTKPSSYVIDMLTRKDRDSLYEYLKTKSWITPSNGLTASYGNLTYESLLTEDFSLFCIKFNLTKEGFENYQQIVQETFQYLDLIKTEGIEEWRFKEMQKIEQLKFDNKTKSSPINTVINTILPLNNGVNIKDILSFPLYFDFDKASIQETFESLTPENLRIFLMAKNVDTNQTETWYQVPYKIEAIPEELLQQWKPTSGQKFKLRERNQDISGTPMPLYTGEKQEAFSPTEKYSDSSTALWYLSDRFFKNPKITLQSILLTPLFSDSIEHYLLANMYTELLQEYINIQYAPAAIDALNTIQVSWTRYGLNIAIEGYSLDKIIEIYGKVITDVNDKFQPSEERFDAIKDEKTREYADALLQPRDIVNETREKFRRGSYSAKDLSKAIQQIDFKQLQDFITTVKTDGFALRHFIYGNINQALIDRLDIQALSGNLKQNSAYNTLPYADYIKDASTLLNSETFEHDLKNTTVVMRVYPYAKRSDESTVKSRLLDMIIKPDFYKQIRTEQQLGYIVWSGKYDILYRQNDFGLYFFIQCTKTLQEIIQQDIEAVANDNNSQNVAILTRHIEYVYSAILSEGEQEKLQQLINDFLNNPQSYQETLLETIKNLSIDESNAETQKQELLNGEIDLFVKLTTKTIADLTNDELEKLKQSLIEELTKKPTNRNEVLHANFTEIMIGRNQFTRNQELADLVKGITKEKLLEFYQATTESEAQPKKITGQHKL